MAQEFDELLEAVRAGQRAFNQGDYETAFALVAPDVEGSEGLVVRVREFESRQEALRAAGLEE
jgi:hypothetical protein